MKEKPECHLCEQKILYLEPGMRHTECRLGYSLTEGECVKAKDLKTNDMEKTIEIPEGYEARIEGNKVILEQKESEDERIRKEIVGFIDRVLKDKNVLSLVADRIGDDIPSMIPSWIAYLERRQPVQDREEREYVRTLKSLIADFLRDKEDVNRGYYQDIYDWLDGRHIEQKPAEWSEEDEIHLANAILAAEKEWGADSCTANFLKSLNPQPKQEWSEEDEQNLNACLPYINDKTLRQWLKDAIHIRYNKSVEWDEEDEQYLLICENALAKYCRSEQWSYPIVSKWLEEHCKVLSQLHWKPSEEQINALQAFVGMIHPDARYDAVYSLMDKLKAL